MNQQITIVIGWLIGMVIWSIVKLIMIQKENPLVTYREAAHIVFVRGALSYALGAAGCVGVLFVMPDFFKETIYVGDNVEKLPESTEKTVSAILRYLRTSSLFFGIGCEAILKSVVFRVSAWGRALNKAKETEV